MSEVAPANAGLREAFRDARVLGAIRLAALVGAVLAIWPTLADAEARDLLIVVILLGVGLVNQLAAVVARPGRVRDRLSEAGLVLDVVILGMLLHVSGGEESPLLPLVIVWILAGVVTHRPTGAVLYSALIVVMLVLASAVHDPVLPDQHYLLLFVTLAVGAGAGVGAWLAMRSLDGYERQLLERSLQDPLTGLWNRRAFEQRLESVRAAAQRADESFALAMLDLDHFKRVNDEHGHLVGDAVLREASAILNATVRAADEVFRFGGEEFVILMPATTLGDACAVSERVRRAVREGRPAGMDLTVSVGVSVGTGATVLSDADRLLLDAKAAGRDRTVCASPSTVA